MTVKHTKEILEEKIKSSESWADVCRKLNIKPNTGSQYHIRNRAKKYGIDHSHFLGQSWRRNKNFGPKRNIDLFLVLSDKLQITSDKLKKRLIKEGIKEHRCEKCSRNEWEGQPIPIELDHINGNNKDNKIEKLRILCPNCHAQTDTYCGKNKKKTGPF